MISIIWYLVIYLLELTILCSTRIYISYFLGTPKHPETVRRNWSVPKYSIPLDKNGVQNGIHNIGYR